jgi:hypothetical protein
VFRCEDCGNLSQLKETQHKKTVETRERVYKEYDHKTKDMIEVGKGFEIVKEINVCGSCAGIENKERFKKAS